MVDTIWPMSSTDCHTRGAETTVNLRFDQFNDKVAIAFLIGGAMSLTLHCDSLEEVIAIRDRLSDCITTAKGEPA